MSGGPDRFAQGAKYGGLEVISDAPCKPGSGRRRLFVRCGCGKLFDVRASDLPNGNTKSCGCLFTAVMRKRVAGWHDNARKQKRVMPGRMSLLTKREFNYHE